MTNRTYDRQRILALHIHMSEYIQAFLVRCSAPTRQYPTLEKALQEVDEKKLSMQAEMYDGAPKIGSMRQAKPRT